MRVERHIFGSISGYTTLAHSPGLSSAECRMLESVSFGTPYDPAYRTSLARAPAFWSRPVGAGRRAVTRVLAGEPDDAGRPTLLFVTVVVAATDWDQVLQGDVRPLLRQAALWKWDGAPALTALELRSVSPAPLSFNGAGCDRVLGLISLVELSWAARAPVVVQEDAYSLEELAAVERLLPSAARHGYSAAFRSLSADLPAALNCLARGVPADGRNPVRFLTGAKSPYAQFLARNGLEQAAAGGLHVEYEGFGHAQVEFGELESEDADMGASTGQTARGGLRRGTLAIYPSLLVVLVAVVLAMGVGIGWVARARTLPPPAPWDQFAEAAVKLVSPRADGKTMDSANDLLTQLDGTVFASSARTEIVRQVLRERCDSLKEYMAIRRNAKSEVENIRPGTTADLSGGDSIQALEKFDADEAALLKHWATDRARVEDRSPDICSAIRDFLAERMEDFKKVDGGETSLSKLSAARNLQQFQKWVQKHRELGIDVNGPDWRGLEAYLADKLSAVETRNEPQDAQKLNEIQAQLEKIERAKKAIKDFQEAPEEQARRQALTGSLKEIEEAKDRDFSDIVSALRGLIDNCCNPCQFEQLKRLGKPIHENTEELARLLKGKNGSNNADPESNKLVDQGKRVGKKIDEEIEDLAKLMEKKIKVIDEAKKLLEELKKKISSLKQNP